MFLTGEKDKISLCIPRAVFIFRIDSLSPFLFLTKYQARYWSSRNIEWFWHDQHQLDQFSIQVELCRRRRLRQKAYTSTSTSEIFCSNQNLSPGELLRLPRESLSWALSKAFSRPGWTFDQQLRDDDFRISFGNAHYGDLKYLKLK